VRGVARLPKAEAVVVLDGKDGHLHPSFLHPAAPVVGVEFLQVEDRRVLETRAPFAPGEGVGAEVDKGDETVLQRNGLTRRRHEVRGFPDDFFLRVAGFDAYRFHIGAVFRRNGRPAAGRQGQQSAQKYRFSHI